jgi:hypothetical protein
VGGRLRGCRPGERAASDVGDPLPGRLGLGAGDRLGGAALGRAGPDRPLPPIEASLSGEAGGGFRWCRTAAAACPHDAEGGRIPEFCFAEQAAAGLVTTAAELAYHEGANRGWRAGLALLPDRRAGIVVLANSDAGSAPINAMVQQWMMLSTKP